MASIEFNNGVWSSVLSSTSSIIQTKITTCMPRSEVKWKLSNTPMFDPAIGYYRCGSTIIINCTTNYRIQPGGLVAKVQIDNLTANTIYFYRFVTGKIKSISII